MKRPMVMVALKDVTHVQGLVALGCEMARSLGAELEALYVIEVAPALPLDAESEILGHPGEETLDLAKKTASEMCGRMISTRMVRARHTGEAIVGEARDQGADLLILGYHPSNGLSEMVRGSTVNYVAHAAPCRLIIEVLPPKQA